MTFKNLQQYTFFLLLAIVSIGFLYVINDYIMAIFWAVVLAILFHPIHERLIKPLKYKSAASGVTLILILLIIFAPLFWIGSLVVEESVGIYRQLSISTENSSVTVDLFDRFGEAVSFLEGYGVSENEVKERVASAASTATNWLSSQAVSFGSKTFQIAIQFFLMLYILFFLLRDGKTIVKRLIEILPLGNTREKRLFSKFASITRAVVKGTLVVGIVQGTIGGILFAIAGIQGAILWGVLMTILSVIPAVGAIIIWLPAGLILLATGGIWQGLVVLIGGAVVVSLVDNILRPILVGKDTEMPDVFVLLSTIGGLSVFGITGFVIGPVIAGFFLVVWDMFEERYKKELEQYG